MDNNNQPKHQRQPQQPEDMTTGGESLNDDTLDDPNATTTYDLRQAANEALAMYERAQATIKARQNAEDENPESLDDGDLDDAILFDDSKALIFEIVGSSNMLTLSVAQNIIIGRSDRKDNFSAGLDLTQYGAYQLGLSRKHARIRRNGSQLELEDTGSRNGTFVNEQQLEAHIPYVVRNGDIVRFGNMKVQLRFAKKA